MNMIKKNIGIVVLNYMAYEETKNVVKQFLDLPKNNINLRIMIVDNSSSNKSFEILKDYFSSADLVKVIKTSKNLGFANGNNFGYIELKKMFDPDYVIFSNSDIVLKSKRLFNWILQSDKKYYFGVLGPSVYSLKNNIYQNPCNNWSENLKFNYKLLKQSKLQLLKLYISLFIPKLEKLNHHIKEKDDTEPDHLAVTTDKTLHGSFLVMSRRYLDEFDMPFDSGTFLYMEEAIIRIRCERHNISMVFSPEYEVDHLQAASTEKINKSTLKRKIVRKKNEINSLKRYIWILKEDNT